MAIIQLTDPVFFRNGRSGATRSVGNDSGTAEGRRVVRYTITAPKAGAAGEKITFYVNGIASGDVVPIRFFIGEDSDSHANAGADAPYTGDLILSEDWMHFTADATVRLMPGRTYYLWAFPATDRLGYYRWGYLDYISFMETTGAGFLLPIKWGGKWVWIMLVAKRSGNFLQLAPVVKQGAFKYLGGPG